MKFFKKILPPKKKEKPIICRLGDTVRIKKIYRRVSGEKYIIEYVGYVYDEFVTISEKRGFQLLSHDVFIFKKDDKKFLNILQSLDTSSLFECKSILIEKKMSNVEK